MVTKICPDCGKAFSYDPNPNFPDKRKYCDSCGKSRKSAWENAKNNPPQNPAFSVNPIPFPVSKHDVIIQRVEKPHSLEIGKAGNRHKIYYNDIPELENHLNLLRTAGLLVDDFKPVDIDEFEN